MKRPVVLVLSHSLDATATYLAERLKASGAAVACFDTDSPLDSVHVSLCDSKMQLSWAEHNLSPYDVSTVVYRRPKPLTAHVAGDPYQVRHASDEWAEVLEGFLAHIPTGRWVNCPRHNAAASHKVHQLTEAARQGLGVPSWIVTNLQETARTFLASNSRVVVKPLASGYIERSTPEEDSQIFTNRFTSAHAHLLERLVGCPVLFQQEVPKVRDVRLVALDQDMVACAMHAEMGDTPLDIRRDSMRGVRYASVEIPPSVRKGTLGLLKHYGLRFAALDFGIDADDKWHFFEVNPNGQWAWLDLAGVTDIASFFIRCSRTT